MTVPTGTRHARRPEAPGDATLLRQLVAEAKPELLLLDPVVREQLLDLQLRAQRRGYEAAHPAATYEVLVDERGEAIGRVVVIDTAAELRLVDLAVLAGHQGRGTGSAVLAELQERAGSRALRLSVRSGNVRARELYERRGFRAEPGDGVDIEMTWRADGPAVHR